MERSETLAHDDTYKAKSAKAASVKGMAARPKAAAKKPVTFKQFERPRGGQARAVSDLMPEVGRTAFRRFGFIQSSIVSRWPEIVGERHARVCTPESIRFPVGEKRDGVLQLVVVAAHAPLIQHMTPEIMTRVNRFFGYNAIAKIKLRQGEVKPPRTGATTPKMPSPLDPIPVDLEPSLREIKDPELRAALESLARSMAAAAARNEDNS